MFTLLCIFYVLGMIVFSIYSVIVGLICALFPDPRRTGRNTEQQRRSAMWIATRHSKK